MDKNLIWKTIVIGIAIIVAAINLYPPQEKLKPGIDLAGGTSLIYEIDTTDLKPEEQKDLAQNMIPILLKRIDPTHVANIVMRPQGNTRIEIQLPVASLDTQKKRQAYEDALSVLEKENINLMKIRQALTLDADARKAELESYARGNEERTQILNKLSEVYDLRQETQTQRDTLLNDMEAVKTLFADLDLEFNTLENKLTQWAKLPAEEQKKQIEQYIQTNIKEDIVQEGKLSDQQLKAVSAINQYLELYNKYLPVVDELTQPETGLNAQWDAAVKNLSQLNLNTDLLREVLELPVKSTARSEKIESFKTGFPSRSEKIEAVVAAYDAYRVVGGRLDDPEDLKRMLKGSGVLEFRILPTGEEGNMAELESYRENLIAKGPKLASDSRYVWCEIEDPTQPIAGIKGEFGEKVYVLCSNQKDQALLHDGEKKWKLKKAYPTTDQQGRRAIGFELDDIAAAKFFRITSENLDKPLCILLDDQAISAPNIQSVIRSSGIITGGSGGFTPTEVADMVNKLNAGSFPARLSEVPISEKTISATIGVENRDDGIRAGLIGVAAVVVFMLVYYMLSGAIADIALMLNILLVLGIMAMLQSTFTLPGIAGLILTIGMSVDANVLIFERIREEQNRGSGLKAAIANGYQRAFSTIFDANVTTFGVAAILYMAASEEIKGFAIVLMLGIASSMFTALFVTRVIYDFLTSSRIISNKLAMFSMLQNANINWMGLRPLFLTVSSLFIIGGLSVFFVRGIDKYDIEFIGGTSVEIKLKEGTGFDRTKVEEMISQKLNPVKVYEIEKTGLQFEISTTLTNKTTALLTFKSGQQTIEAVSSLIRAKAAEMGKTLSNLNVSAAGTNAFEVSTSRVNASLVEEVLAQAVGDQASVSNIDVQEVVSDAVRETFKDYLAVLENLGLTFVSSDRIEVGTDEATLLADFLGGIKLTCQLDSETTVADLKSRLSSIEFKQDMQDLKRYPHKILNSNLIEPADNEKLKTFVYVSVHPDAGYRELEDDEWQNYVENEKTKLSAAASLETSLSRVTQIDPSIGSQAKQRAMVAVILSLIAIVGYIWIRFGTARYGFAAIAALVHDVCITLGLVSVCTYIAGTPIGNMLGIQDFKINLEMIAAFLTIIGYSLNDTIVVFDRIRENRGKLSILTPEMISSSINQTLSRTLLTSFTTFLVVLVMYIWGGTGLRGFTFALLVGVVVGTYSSIAIAAPILLLGESKTVSKK